MVLFGIRLRRCQHPGLVAHTSSSAHCIKRKGSPLQPILSRAWRPGPVAVSSRRSKLFLIVAWRRCRLLSGMDLPHAGLTSKCSPRFQSPRSSTASLRATAVRAFLAPTRFISLRPQLRKAEDCRTVVSRQFAAS